MTQPKPIAVKQKPIAVKHKHLHAVAPSITELVRQLRRDDGPQFLYRGQNGLYGPHGNFACQIPSVYRSSTTTGEATAALRQSHLRVAWLFDKVRRTSMISPEHPDFDMTLAFATPHLGDLSRPASPAAILGIAQHYGIPTENLDLTSLDPAAVFATQHGMSIRTAARFSPGSCAPSTNEPRFASSGKLRPLHSDQGP